MNKYTRLPIEKLATDVAVDPMHVRELADSIKVSGPISPVIVREDNLALIDGFHRVAALKELGFKDVECISTSCDDETFWDLRIMSASLHKAVTFARVIDWIEEVFKSSSLRKHWEHGGGREYKSAYSVFASYTRGNPPKEVKEWVETKAAKWGLGPNTIENWLYTKQTLAPELLKEAASPSKGEVGLSAYQIVAEVLHDKPELQTHVIEKAKAEGLSTKQVRILAQALRQAPEKVERITDIIEEEMRGLQKRLEIFPEKSQKIEPKFEKFEALVERGVIPYTIWDFQYRDDYAGDKDFHGNCSPQIVEQCIWRLSEEGDLVVDPMAGSGTALDVCRRFNRRCIGYDIKPLIDREDIIQSDSRRIPLDSDSVDMIFIHPPYWNLTYFTRAEERLPDLSRANTLQQFLEMLEDVFQECFRVLKPRKYMCALLGDLIREGRFIPLCRKATDLAEKIGFIDYGYAVKLAHGEVSRKKSGVIVAEPLYTDNLKISHDLVMFFRKPL